MSFSGLRCVENLERILYTYPQSLILRSINTMKINIDKDLLLDNLTVASRFVSNRFSSVPSLQGILFETKYKHINLYATNLTSFFHTKIKNPTTEEKKIVFDPKKVMEFLSLLTPGIVELDIEDSQLVIRKDKTKGTFSLINAEDFPYPPIVKEKEEKIKTDVLKKHLPLVLFAASSDYTRPVLNGVNFLTQDDEIALVATDGFRLSLLKMKKEDSIPQMLVPKGFLEEVVRLSKEEKEMGLRFSEKEKVISFTFGDTTVYSRLITGDFPPFEKVIPSESKTKAVIEKDEFLRNIRIVSVFAREVSNIALLSFGKDGITMSPKTERDDQNSTLQDADVEGPPQKVAFNFKFIIDFLMHAPDKKKIIIEVLRPDAPVVFKIEGNKDFLHVIMPVRIRT